MFCARPLAAIPKLEAITSWNGTNGIGRLYSNQNQTDARAFRRGGNWGDGSYAGVLSLNLTAVVSYAHAANGFRAAR